MKDAIQKRIEVITRLPFTVITDYGRISMPFWCSVLTFTH